MRRDFTVGTDDPAAGSIGDLPRRRPPPCRVVHRGYPIDERPTQPMLLRRWPEKSGSIHTLRRAPTPGRLADSATKSENYNKQSFVSWCFFCSLILITPMFRLIIADLLSLVRVSLPCNSTARSYDPNHSFGINLSRNSEPVLLYSDTPCNLWISVVKACE